MLSGSLEVFSLTDVLRLVCGAGAMGRLHIRRGDRAGNVLLAGGKIAGAVVEGQEPPDEDGSIDAALEMLQGEGGEFEMQSGPVEGPLDLDLETFLERVREREAEWNEVAQVLGSVDGRLVLIPDPGADSITVSADEWRVIALCAGDRSARDIAAEIGGTPFRVYRTLAVLVREGLVAPEGMEVQVVDAPQDATEEVGEQPEATDGSELDPAALLRELGSAPASERPQRRIRILTREEQRMRLRK